MKYCNYIVVPLILFSLLPSCKTQTAKAESHISSTSIILGQINHIDTSLYQITKYETNNNIVDTTYISRDIFRVEAKPFLELADITNEKMLSKYKEEKIVDTEQSTLSIIHTALNENLEIQKQIMIVDIQDPENAKVVSIYIDKIIIDNNTSTQLRLFWQLDSYFQIATITQSKTFPEQLKLVRITWK